jgi:Fe-S cluster biogenesis protein NfuA
LESGFRMHAERTPNPNSVKWVLERPVMTTGGFAGFDDPVEPEVSPLAARLHRVPGVVSVLLGADFVTLTKGVDTAWADVAEPVAEAIRDWADSGEHAVGSAWQAPRVDTETGVTERINKILEDEIAPYVAQDGGEIVLAGYEDGVVQLHLRGACDGCPSSTITLKMGIEARLREEIPEIRSVVAV